MELNFDIGTLVCVFALYGMWTFGKDMGRLICDVTLKVWKANKNTPNDELGMTTCPPTFSTSHESPNTPEKYETIAEWKVDSSEVR